MRMPSKVLIGTQMWMVSEQKRKHSADPDHYGFTTSKDCTIIIDAEMPTSMKRVTLFHELLHAIRFTFGGSYAPPSKTTYGEWEHFFIGMYEEPVLMMLRDNPDLVAFLLDTNDA